MSTDRTTEILNYLSAMSRDVGDLRTQVGEVRVEIGDLRGEIGNLRGEIGNLRGEIGEVRTEMRTGMDKLSGEVVEVRKEVRALTNRFDRLEARVLNTHADVDDLEGRVAALEGKQD
jgi:predicted RNase H-like nuclease (RuvC/YqgF family)